MRRLLICWLLTIYAGQVMAAALPSRMQTALAGLLQSKMANRGFASNDPRYAATVSSAGSQLAGAAAGATVIVVGAATAPAWITVGLSIGMSYAVSLAFDGLLKWIIGDDGTVKIPGQGNPNNVPGGNGPSVMYNVGGSRSASLAGACAGWGSSQSGVDSHGSYTIVWSGQMMNDDCHAFMAATSADPKYSVPYQDNGRLGYSIEVGCAGINLGPVGGICPPSNFPDKGGNVYPTIGDAVRAISSEDAAKAVNPAILADLANDAWRDAAAVPGYAGLPYDASDPITPTDVEQWQQNNPSAYPNVGDAVNPQPSAPGGGVGDPFTLPNGSPGGGNAPVTPTNPSTEPLANLGPDPGIGAPGLEATPTAQQIMAPVLNLFPNLKSFVVPSHSAECPKPSMTLFGKTMVLDAHCSVLEGVRATLFACMALVWVLVSLFIVLRA